MHTLHSFVNFLHALLFYLCVTLRSVNLLRHPAQVTPNTFLHISTHLLILLLSTVYLSATCGSRESTLSPAYCGNLCVVTCAVNTKSPSTHTLHSTLFSFSNYSSCYILSLSPSGTCVYPLFGGKHRRRHAVCKRVRTHLPIFFPSLLISFLYLLHFPFSPCPHALERHAGNLCGTLRR